MPQFLHLFSEIRIGNCVIPNRIVSTGHHTYLSDSVPDDRLVAYHEARARGGAGLIVTEIIASHETAGFSSHLLQAGDREAIPAYRRLADTCRRHGSKMFAQLFHPGREILSAHSGMLPVAWAPSAVPNERFHIMPKPMPVALIEEIIAGHGVAAANLAEAGLDGFEIVASHGYLPAQFLNPRTNHRQDEYGGDVQGRRRFLREIIREIRKSAPGLALGMRISGSEMVDDGLQLEEMVALCRALSAELDYISVVAGTSASLGASVHIVPPMGMPGAYVASQSETIRKAAGIPVMVAGRINQPQVAEQVIAQGQADLCGMTRAMICDAGMANKARKGALDTIRSCIGCNQSCIGRAHQGLGISCIQHPESGRETEFGELPGTGSPKRVLVVGGGPGGLKAAAIAAARGHDVLLHEQEDCLGGQARLAMKLPGREDFGGIIDNLEREARQAGVNVVLQSRVTPETIRDVRADSVILATGARPFVPDIEGLHSAHAVTAWDILTGSARAGATVVIADWRSDWVGLGIAEKLAAAGSVVELVTNSSMAGEALQAYTRNHFVRRIKKLGVRISTHARLYGIDGSTVFFQDTLTDDPVVIEGIETVVLSLGHVSVDPLSERIENRGMAIYSIGDCVTPRTAEEAVYEGLTTAWSI
ncbi:MAG: FAD-dependent oxidoreductase [Gammaproteobacteria bacterium]|nr:FAD-dependent oxidoreductase [Gammaproteobacteria bacterium]